MEDDKSPNKTEREQTPLEKSPLSNEPMVSEVSLTLSAVEKREEFSVKRTLTPDKLKSLAEEAQHRVGQLMEKASLERALPHVDRESKEVYLPSSLVQHEHVTYLSVCKLASLIGASVVIYETDIACATVRDANSFLDGLLIGIFDSKSTRLDRAKKPLELGRSIAFALKIRGELIKFNKIDLLMKNNFYFGNNPDEKVGNIPVPFGSKQKMIELWENVEVGGAIYSVFLYLFEELGLSQYSDEDVGSIVLKHTLRFDEIVAKFYQPIRSNRKGKTVITGYRKGQKPNPSPLLTRREYELLMEIASPLWTDLDSFKRNWPSFVLSNIPGAEIISRIGIIYKSRFEFLQKFGSLTTKRLQEARKFVGNATIKKVDVKAETLTGLLKNRENPGNKFIREVEKLIETNSWVVVDFENRKGLQEGEFKKFLYKEIMSSYIEDNYFPEYKDKVFDVPILMDKQILGCFEIIKAFAARLRNLSGAVAKASQIFEVKLLDRRTVAILTLYEQVKGAIHDIFTYQKPVHEFILNHMLDIKATGTDFHQFLTSLSTLMDEMHGRIRRRDWISEPTGLAGMVKSITDLNVFLRMHIKFYSNIK